MLKRLQGDVPVRWSGKGSSALPEAHQVSCLCRAARIRNMVGQENHIRHQPQPATIQTIQHFISPLSQLQVHNELPQAGQLLGHNLATLLN